MNTQDAAAQEPDDSKKGDGQFLQDEGKEEETQTSASRPLSPLLGSRRKRRGREPQSPQKAEQPRIENHRDSSAITPFESATGRRSLFGRCHFFPCSLRRAASVALAVIRCYLVYATLCFFCLVLLYSCFLPSLFIDVSRYNRVPSAFLAVSVPVSAPNGELQRAGEAGGEWGRRVLLEQVWLGVGTLSRSGV